MLNYERVARQDRFFRSFASGGGGGQEVYGEREGLPVALEAMLPRERSGTTHFRKLTEEYSSTGPGRETSEAAVVTSDNPHAKKSQSRFFAPERLKTVRRSSVGDKPDTEKTLLEIDQGKRKNATGGPGPGAYDAKLDQNYFSSFRPGNKEHVSFGGSAARFNSADGSGADGSGQPTVQNDPRPGPGNYDVGFTVYDSLAVKAQVKKARTSQKPFVPTRSIRHGMEEPGTGSNKPGPGSYDLNRSLLKKTYNVTTDVRLEDYRKGRSMAARGRAGDGGAPIVFF